MNENFNDLPWHDATLKNIEINRMNPGEHDIITLLISWPDCNYNSVVEFSDCYAFTANMNFGVIASETILTAECLNESEELKHIRNLWLKVNIDLHDLKCFKIKTNSTNSIINILSLNFKVKNHENFSGSH